MGRPFTTFVSLLSSLLVYALPQAAAATTVAPIREYDERLGETYYFVDIEGDARPNDITAAATRRARTIVVSDAYPIEIDDSSAGRIQECRSLRATRVRCEGPARTRLHVSGGEGDDRAALSGRLGAVLGGDTGDDTIAGAKGKDYIDGGEGDDHVSGGPARDSFDQSGGDDVLRGGRGPDDLNEGFFSGHGSDSLIGGRGADELFADDHTQDRRIDCGPGRKDVARIDSVLDPTPIGCERVEPPR